MVTVNNCIYVEPLAILHRPQSENHWFRIIRGGLEVLNASNIMGEIIHFRRLK